MKENLNKILRIVCIGLIITMMQPFNMIKVFAEEHTKTMTILFTHDMHDHFLPFKVKQNEKVLQLGGYARLQSAINEEEKKSPNSILIDAGDFSMGTLLQSVYASDAPELRLLGKMGYDVTTLGNHEFDFRATGLTKSLNAAIKSGDKLPQIVQANMEFPIDKNGNLTKTLSDLKQAMKVYGVKDYTVIERSGIKIGVFGLMGKDAASNAPMSEVKFTDAVKNAKRMVQILKEKEKVDLIICLSHSGIDKDKSKSEDEILAKKVPEINVIISGHTHSKLNKPIVVGNTIIGSCGEYSENLGVIKISKNIKKGWELDSYNLKQIDSSLEADKNIFNSIKDFKNIVQQKYLNNFGMKFDEVLAKTDFNFVASSQIGNKHGEEPLGNLISDAYIYAVKKAEGPNYNPISVAIVPSGTIRGSFVKGDITVSDVFTVSSLGIGKDGITGYPLISAYLTGKELKTACEVDASITPMMSNAQLYMSGISYTFNPNRMIFNRVTNAILQKLDGTYEEINDTKLYRVVVGLYSAQMLSIVGEKSFGLLSIVPKTKDGTSITDFEAQIITDTVNGRNKEVKEWKAIAEYIKSFDKVEGISNVPQYYNKVQGRKIVNKDKSIHALFSHPNNIALGVYAIVTIFGSVVAFVVVMIVKHKKKLKKKEKKSFF
ncbi:bifunctional UDP-sugar hydrolase/5'-nucleotidase [Clostridium aestuarii]|uniref:Bifunctional UDP-sugar hydrolase/5'-nucleotidase n=1 Tax=Clostridium aestuarii TaxID=338193 RepID=A0ABT4D194_9CLOT|nr:bifunctional UDP-sugar hydrolase/5'-nucleotidase [Clostridium aestuarii]MCY6484085.1 bifunctional UDP-sugar hydrolase/5'-nucleotidase [Clostridium aestuarii]